MDGGTGEATPTGIRKARRALTVVSLVNIAAILVLLLFFGLKAYAARQSLGWFVYGLPVCLGWLGLASVLSEFVLFFRSGRDLAPVKFAGRLVPPGLSVLLAAAAFTAPFWSFFFAVYAVVGCGLAALVLRSVSPGTPAVRKVLSSISLANIGAVVTLVGFLTCWPGLFLTALSFLVSAPLCVAAVGTGCFVAEVVVFFARAMDLSWKKLLARLAPPLASAAMAGLQFLAVLATVASNA